MVDRQRPSAVTDALMDKLTSEIDGVKTAA